MDRQIGCGTGDEKARSSEVGWSGREAMDFCWSSERIVEAEIGPYPSERHSRPHSNEKFGTSDRSHRSRLTIVKRVGDETCGMKRESKLQDTLDSIQSRAAIEKLMSVTHTPAEVLHCAQLLRSEISRKRFT